VSVYVQGLNLGNLKCDRCQQVTRDICYRPQPKSFLCPDCRGEVLLEHQAADPTGYEPLPNIGAAVCDWED